jgi:hypothetical protein
MTILTACLLEKLTLLDTIIVETEVRNGHNHLNYIFGPSREFLLGDNNLILPLAKTVWEYMLQGG